MRKKDKLVAILIAVIILIAINLLAAYTSIRIDLTQNKRYTLSEPAISSLASLKNPVFIDILLEGDLPPEFARLKIEVQQILEAFSAENKNLKYDFADPLEDISDREATIAELQRIGLNPANITIEENGKVSQEFIFPWAMVTYQKTTVKVPLLKNKLGATTKERINNSVQALEYAFADAFTKLGIKEKKRVAVIKGNGELADQYLADFLTSIRDYYNVGAITLDSVKSDPQTVLEQLKSFDLALIAKPTEPFTDAEKYILDQFIVQGGKSIWLIDAVAIELDSLMNDTGSALATARDLNLDDFFFKYGIRVNPVLINDLYFTQIVLASGDGSNSQFNPVPWYYNPMVFSRNDHVINNNIEALRLQFTGNLDTLKNNYNKTILSWSSALSKVESTPRPISFSIINSSPQKESYTDGPQPLAVLIEGAFTSAFDNRVSPLKLENTILKGPKNKMLVIADGDIIKNQISNGRPLELGYDKWTSNIYGNKDFLMNSINYLLDDTGLINIRNKKVVIALLDQKKITDKKIRWQVINVGLPVIFMVLIGVLFGIIRKRKFGR